MRMTNGRGKRMRELLQCFATSLYLIFGETGNPQAPFNDARHGFEPVFCAGVNETEKTLDDPRCCAIALEVDKQPASAAIYLCRLLGIISEIVDVKTWEE
jgi:hypothetical protein